MSGFLKKSAYATSGHQPTQAGLRTGRILKSRCWYEAPPGREVHRRIVQWDLTRRLLPRSAIIQFRSKPQIPRTQTVSTKDNEIILQKRI